MDLQDEKNMIDKSCQQLKKLLQKCENLRALARVEIIDAKNSISFLEFLSEQKEIDKEKAKKIFSKADVLFNQADELFKEAFKK